MSTVIFPRLALTNMKKNSKTYLPYLAACIFTSAMTYIMKSLSLNKGLGETTSIILKFGNYVILIFDIIFLFYTNSFLLKNRKKEFGLFNILGMEKRHIARIIGFESLFSAVICLAGGCAVGIFLDKLMFVIISRIIKIPVKLGFHISVKALLTTVVVFSFIFFIIYLNSIRIVYFSKTTELLKGGNIGEKEPKAKWILTILGLLSLGAGYYIAITVKNPVTAINLFFAAVILVIIGTYLIFIAGSITLLKLLKKSKRYYYKTNHFISVSGMMYRMKQNAVGLANICILSTMVLVMVSSTTSLIFGTQDMLKRNYPRQFSYSVYSKDISDLQLTMQTIYDTAKDKDITLKNTYKLSSLQFDGIIEGNSVKLAKTADYNTVQERIDALASLCEIFVITADDYSAYTGMPANLRNNEVIIWDHGVGYDNNMFIFGGKQYTIRSRTDTFFENEAQYTLDMCPTLGIVVKDLSILIDFYNVQNETYGAASSPIVNKFCFDTDLDKNEQIAFGEELNSFVPYGSSDIRALDEQETYQLYGSMFFLGIFLGIMFTVAAVLIIYYKQISEGYDDKERFEIMQKVGLTEDEVKGSVRSQVLTVFFLPLIMAGIHIAMAFPIIRKMLTLLQLVNTNLFIICTAVSFLVFALIYAVIYVMTAKVYYKIVKGK